MNGLLHVLRFALVLTSGRFLHFSVFHPVSDDLCMLFISVFGPSYMYGVLMEYAFIY